MSNSSNQKYVLIVVGAGGTGTYFLKEFSRFISGTKNEELFKAMYIIDGDRVEKKNLSRQCFCEDDIGRNKASVMAEILNDAFSLQFKAKVSYLTELKQLRDISEAYGVGENIRNRNTVTIPVIVGCVDNHGCRLLLEKYFKEEKNCIYFDSANEFDTGEVVYSYKFNGNVISPVRSVCFPDIKKADIRTREELSCEELNNAAPQHIFTNMLAGNLLCGGMANLLNGVVTPGFSYFNSLKYESGFCPWNGGESHA